MSKANTKQPASQPSKSPQPQAQKGQAQSKPSNQLAKNIQTVSLLKITDEELRKLDPTKIFNEKQIQKFKECFSFFDRQGKGTVPRSELPQMLRAMGQLVSTLEARELAAKLDKDNKKLLTFQQYLVGLCVFNDRKPNSNEIQGALQVFDKDKSGFVSCSELKSILMTVGDLVSPAEFDAVFSELQANKQGKVSTKELVDLLMIQPL